MPDIQQDAITHYHLGNDYYKQRNLDAAIGAYSKAIELNPDYAEAYCGLGVAYDDQGAFDRP